MGDRQEDHSYEVQSETEEQHQPQFEEKQQNELQRPERRQQQAQVQQQQQPQQQQQQQQPWQQAPPSGGIIYSPNTQGGQVIGRASRIKDRPTKPVADDESSLKIKIELDLEAEVELYARVKGDVTIGLM